MNPPTDPAVRTVDGTGLLCVTLLLRLRKEIDGVPPGTIVHVIATDPVAPIDLPAWCHLTGHTWLGRQPSESGTVYAIRVAAAAAPVDQQRPWITRR
ncbi:MULTISPECIES: sulfurtransferase TusA family protein [unclassified Micromonospora]|uniref:sulfurtransferase TusA family protein n=1 Tax=unclassified Micromonospora TaxID=2617518 RepID=UPI00332E66E7